MRFQVVLLFFIAFLSVSISWSATIEFPEEELAKETVVPQFDSISSVKNKTVAVSGRFEVGLGGGLNLQEALYNNQNFHGNLHYNFSEIHAIGLTRFFISKGLSEMGKELKAGRGIEPDTFDASLAPSPESILLAEYQLTAYYGKISVTKSSVMNLALYGLLGGGTVSFLDSSSPTFSIGFGQKFYLNKHIAIRGDLRFVLYEGPNPVQDNPDLQTGDAPVSTNDLDKTQYFPTFLNFSIELII